MNDGIGPDARLNILGIIGASIPLSISHLHFDCDSLVDEWEKFFFCNL